MTAAASRPIHVLHTVRSLRIDGVVKVILRNVSYPGAPDIVHHVCAMIDEDHLAGEYRAQGIEPEFAGFAGLGTLPATVRRLMRIIRERGIDVVHANRTVDLGIAGLAARLCGVPVVSTLHWLGRLEDHPEDTQPWIKRRLEAFATVLINRALPERIVAVSDAVLESFDAQLGFPTSRTEVVYPGLHMEPPAGVAEQATRLRAELGLEGRGPILLNVGRLHEVKGQHHLPAMMRRVRERLPDAVLLVAGEGERRPLLEALIAEHGVEDAVRLIGARSDVDALLALSDLLVLSSESEAAPLPLFEAMRAARAVVATDVGGVTEIVRPGETGFVVPRGDAQAMADAAVRILETPGLAAQMGASGHRLALERFDIGHSIRALERIYRTLAQGKRARGRGRVELQVA